MHLTNHQNHLIILCITYYHLYLFFLNYFSFVFTSYIRGKKLGSFDYLLVESPPLFLGYSAIKLKNKLHAYVRYFRELKPLGHDMWLTPTFINDTGLEQAMAGNKITASQSERLEIKPMNLIGDNTPRKALELQSHCLCDG